MVLNLTVLDPQLLDLIHATKGFMPDDEGAALYAAALSISDQIGGPFLEVGAYCGRSAVYLGEAARQTGRVLYSLDHHHGSEENQSGWEHHDTEVVDPRTGRMDTLPFFRRTIESAGLESSVVALVGHSIPVARHWTTPLALLFIDGGHGKEPAAADYAWWTPKVAPGGLFIIHDVFPNSADGGRPPYEDIYLPALQSGLFAEDPTRSCGSLRVLQRCQ